MKLGVARKGGPVEMGAGGRVSNQKKSCVKARVWERAKSV